MFVERECFVLGGNCFGLELNLLDILCLVNLSVFVFSYIYNIYIYK